MVWGGICDVPDRFSNMKINNHICTKKISQFIGMYVSNTNTGVVGLNQGFSPTNNDFQSLTLNPESE